MTKRLVSNANFIEKMNTYKGGVDRSRQNKKREIVPRNGNLHQFGHCDHGLVALNNG